MDRKMVNFIREQYPPGTRIRLNSMEDPYAPIAPGTEGKVDFVDDIGTIHMKWDNGRSLGIVPGEDSFSVLPPKLTTFKLYMPLTAELYERSEYGDLESEGTELDGSALRSYQDQIMAELVKSRMPEETERGLMHWYGKDDGINTKVHSAFFTVEERDRLLWGVAECRVAGELSAAEQGTLKKYITGQAADGWGEHFEQCEILVDGGSELYVHLWNADDWSIQTEQECFTPKLAEGLPELCFSVLPSTGELICIKRGESGYYPSDWSTDDPAQNRELADYNNDRLGVTQAQRLAMECGSILPDVAPLLGMLMLGNLFKESGVVNRLSDTAQNSLCNIVTIMIGLSVGATANGEAFIQLQTIAIVVLGLVAFSFSTVGGLLIGKLLCKLTHGRINPLIGSAGVSAVPMAARVSQKVGSESNPQNFLLMHAMGPNVAGVIGSAVAAGFFMLTFG